MICQDQLELLKQGVEAWNTWRQKNSDVEIYLMTADLRGVDIRGANLRRAEFSNANLSNANLSGANLGGAYFSGANLSGANLSGAYLSDADFRRANLRGANLIGANLRGANLIKADLSEADITGVRAYIASHDYWKIENIRCDYVIWDSADKERTPKDRDFKPGEFEELYKWRPMNDFESLIERSIEFPPEYKQAGVSILNYFSEILRQRYPESEATVQIKQYGLKVTMTIDPVDGKREIIEKTLNDYGLVITGKMLPEEFESDPLQVMALRNKLEIAQMELRQTKQLLQFTEKHHSERIESLEQRNRTLEEDVKWLRNTVGTAIQSRPVTVTVIGGDAKDSTLVSGNENKLNEA